jgi:hypothetical protein
MNPTEAAHLARTLAGELGRDLLAFVGSNDGLPAHTEPWLNGQMPESTLRRLLLAQQVLARRAQSNGGLDNVHKRAWLRSMVPGKDKSVARLIREDPQANASLLLQWAARPSNHS